MNLKSPPRAVAALLLLCLTMTPVAVNAELQPMVIGGLMEMPTPPYLWFDQCDNQPSGASTHLLQRVLDQLKIDYVFAPPMPMTWQALADRRERLRQGEYDALIAVRKDNNVGGMQLSNFPMVRLQDAILYRKDRGFKIEGAAELKPLQGAIAASADYNVVNSPVGRWMERNQLNYRTMTSREQLIKALLANEVDYIILERYRALATFLDKPAQAYLELVPIQDNIRDLYFSMSVNSPYIGRMAEINRELEKLETSGNAEVLRYSYLRTWLNTPDCHPINGIKKSP